MEARNDVWVEGQVQSLFTDEPPWCPSAEKGIARLQERRAARQRKAMRQGILVVVFVLLAAGSLAIPGTRVYARRCVEACVTGTSIVWSKLPKPVTADRRLAPDFALPDANGRIA